MPIQFDDPRLENMQANILKGHGRKHSLNVFFKISDPVGARRWIAHLAVTSAHTQLVEARLYKRRGIPGKSIVCIALSHLGLTALGVAEGTRSTFCNAFRVGMPKRKLNDPPTECWDILCPHGWLLVADDDLSRMESELKKLLAAAGNSIRAVRIERGEQQYDSAGRGIEHFGYVDGRSQPLFFTEDIEAERTAAGLETSDCFDWDPGAAIESVAFPDPLASEEVADALGSYFVFRKLEQNVEGFKARERELAEQLVLYGEDTERAGAMVVGRFEDGTPVVLSDEETGRQSATNDFNYNGSETEIKCPLHAHIRLTNRRDGSERGKLMARRGITYGYRHADSGEFTNFPTGGVGLLFGAYMSNIDTQFEAVQIAANGTGNSLDPVIGQDAGASPQVWPSGFDPKINCQFRFGGFVTMRGGEYFFAPSLPGLKAIRH